ncbi:MAG: type II toxin-antitoxin system VapC family toxin [Planctomycetes bacterium]|nr:type II toxin-antitoxin system VapC family toxin [Planctomycetota bacterium]MBM4086067.1 type II toxin-antitoxin system VapC family toxin [Planctomycetota bacterium]
MNAAFGDTFYFLGLTNPDDQAHAKCLDFSRDFRGAIITTTAVLLELGNALAKPAYRERAASFIRSLPNDPSVTIVQLSPSLFDRGLALYTQHSDKGWSLTDCIAFVVMRDEGLTDALTGDRHFEQAGFTILLK